jgi:hypothetical protein
MPLVIEKTESGGFELHPEEDWVDGQITAIEETDGQWGAGLKFIIVLDGEETADDGYPRETWAFCSQKLSPRSKLYAWAKGLGWDPEDETLDLNDFIDSRVQVMFERYDGHDNDGNSVEKEKITKLRKGKGKAKKQAKRPLKAVDEEYDDSPF